MSTALIRHTTQVPALPHEHEWQTMVAMGDALFRSGLLPVHIRNAQAAVAVIQKGRELQIPPFYALCNIVVIQGKPTCSAELMLALIYRDHGDDAIRFVETTSKLCRVAYKRQGWSKPAEFAFVIEDAQRAGLLTGKADAAWTKYPQAMLRARAISAVARLAFPDSIAGMYMAEELGAGVEVEPTTGEITVLPPTPSNGHDQQGDSIDGLAAQPPMPASPASSEPVHLSTKPNFKPEWHIDGASESQCQAVHPVRGACDKRDLFTGDLHARCTQTGLPPEITLCTGHARVWLAATDKPAIVWPDVTRPDETDRALFEDEVAL